MWQLTFETKNVLKYCTYDFKGRTKKNFSSQITYGMTIKWSDRLLQQNYLSVLYNKNMLKFKKISCTKQMNKRSAQISTFATI